MSMHKPAIFDMNALGVVIASYYFTLGYYLQQQTTYLPVGWLN